MHQIIYSYRRILPEEIPTITPIDEATRPMTDADLLNVGLVRVTGDIFSCVHQEERDPRTLEWSPKDGQVLPGVVLSEGSFRERHAALPADARDEIVQAQAAQVTETSTVDVSPSTDAVTMSMVADPTVVEQPAPTPEPSAEFVPPHSWAGENTF